MRRPRSQAPRRKHIDTGNYDAEYLLGPYQRLELARSSDAGVRGNAASGGVLTEVCASLLERGEVDAVVGVGLPHDDPVTPRVLVSRSRDELLERSGSVYCYITPGEFMKVAHEIVSDRVAVICQPCLVPMLRRYQARRRQENVGVDIRYVFSFFCGYNMTHDATLFLLHKAGVRPEEVEWVRYRHGDYPGGFVVRAKDGREVGFGKEAYEYLNLAFVRSGCYRCSLYMGEGADLSCGDAWLREHRQLTACVVRNDAGRAALDAAGDRLERYELPEASLMHMHLHNLIYKKHGNPMPLRMLAVLFQDLLPPGWAPFGLLTRLSRMRRKRKIGISLPVLTPIEETVATPGGDAVSAPVEPDDA